MKGTFITFEGAEGSGKSTQADLVCRYLRERDVPVLLIREPGGVKISESIRRILLNVNHTHMTDECETLLYMAARSQLVKEVILPALKAGKVILCDRFLDSTVAYQGFGSGVDVKSIKAIGEFAVQGVGPQLTLLFDIEPDKGLSRTGRNKDRIERRPLAYHDRVRKGYLKLAKQDPLRIKVIRVDRDKDEIFLAVRGFIDEALKLSRA